RLDQMEQSFAQRVEAFQREQHEAAVAGEFARQEAVLLAQGRSDEELKEITDLSLAHSGNLLAAAGAYDAMKQRVLSAYLASKQEAERSPVAPIAGGAHTSQVPHKPKNLEEATDIAMEALRAAGMDTLDI